MTKLFSIPSFFIPKLGTNKPPSSQQTFFLLSQTMCFSKKKPSRDPKPLFPGPVFPKPAWSDSCLPHLSISSLPVSGCTPHMDLFSSLLCT